MVEYARKNISDICLYFGSEYPSPGKPRYRPIAMDGSPRDGYSDPKRNI
jgi:hypothetical protein